MNILSIQSHVAYGHVGNSAAVFPLQRIGVEVWPVDTVQYSNHPGYGSHRGRALSAEAIRMLIVGIEERGVLGECDGVLSGYLGSGEIGDAVADAVEKVKAANPAARYCCDPVIGNSRRGVFVHAGVPEVIDARLLPAADVLTPNQFELNLLSKADSHSLRDALAAIDTLHHRGPRVILVTSLKLDDTPDDFFDMLVSGEDGRFRLRTPRLPILPNGAGDVMAALFFAHFLRSGEPQEAMSLAASALFGVLTRTVEEGSKEMLMVEAQDELVKPRKIFATKRVVG